MARKKKERVSVGEVLAKANAAKPIEKPKRTRRKASEGWPCTAEQIIEQRDKLGLSWKQVSLNLGLGNPGAARKAYSELVGRHHSESGAVKKRAPRGSMTAGGKVLEHLQWNDETDQDEILAKVVPGSHLVIRREFRGIQIEESVEVYSVEKLAWDGKEEDGPLVIYLKQFPNCDRADRGRTRDIQRTAASRIFRVSDIVSVR